MLFVFNKAVYKSYLIQLAYQRKERLRYMIQETTWQTNRARLFKTFMA